MQITWKGSPNFDTNRKAINTVVIHWFGKGTLESANTRFQDKTSKVSAHYGISGSRVWQWVKEENVAYHSDNYAVNQKSLGIEHSATPDRPASEETYQTSAKLIRDICLRYGIPIDREHIIKHSQVKPTQCPGTIDLDKLIKLANIEDMPTWLNGLLQENGISSDSAEGRIREIFDQAKRYETAQKERDKALRDLAEARGDSTKFEENYITAQKENKRLADEIDELKRSVASRDTQVTALEARVLTLEGQLNPEKVLVITREEYARLTAKKQLDKFTKWELVQEIVKRFIVWKRGDK